jgi:hypothetical protein
MYVVFRATESFSTTLSLIIQISPRIVVHTSQNVAVGSFFFFSGPRTEDLQASISMTSNFHVLLVNTDEYNDDDLKEQ